MFFYWTWQFAFVHIHLSWLAEVVYQNMVATYPKIMVYILLWNIWHLFYKDNYVELKKIEIHKYVFVVRLQVD